MRFEQTRTVLQQLAPRYHRTVSDHYQTLADGEVSPRVQLMLDYLIDHEQQRALALREFCEEGICLTLDHWLKGVEVAFPDPSFARLGDACKTDLNHLLCAAIGYKQALINYFEHLLDHCNDKKTLGIFQNLKTQEEKAMKRMIRHAQGLADL